MVCAGVRRPRGLAARRPHVPTAAAPTSTARWTTREGAPSDERCTWTMHLRWGSLLALAAVVSFLGCGRLVFGPPPRIDSFSADTSEAGSGEPVTLRWRTAGAGE